MKNTIIKTGLFFALAAGLSGCSKFDEMNINPLKVTEEQVEIEYLFNDALIGAQQDPNIAERIFVLYWKNASRQHLATGLAGGTNNDGYSNEYWGRSYGAKWLSSINKAIKIGESRIADGSAEPHINTMVQIARVWRAYLLSELSDNFGPMPLNGFEGENPTYNSVEDIYKFILTELKDASNKLDNATKVPEAKNKFDVAYNFDAASWRKYANSLRMRYAIRISEVAPQIAKTEFEDAVKDGIYIKTAAEMFKVQEKSGWDPLTGVMSREWNGQVLSATLNNIYLGLGGIKSTDQLATSFHTSIKPENYVGKRLLGHYSVKTNDPSAGYFFDGLPHSIDPRAYKTFYIPGDVNSSTWINYPSWTDDAKTTKVNLNPIQGFNTDTLKLDTKNTWSTTAIGDFGAKGTANEIRSVQIGKIPGLASQFRRSEAKRIFFAAWESYFLLAEASLKGWTTGTTAQAAYEDGIKANFEYWGVSQHLSTYLASEDFNRVGTSVKFTHTTEPGNTHQMSYVDGYTSTTGTASIAYPVNSIYKNGTIRNDALTKIITQKYIANMPWLPLEAWSDHRRLGLPFFENPAIENPLPNLPDLNNGNFMTNNIKFFPQRIPYPSNFRTASPDGYAQATSLLGGEDKVLTPLWWAKKN
ncbi:SusD/RagB family nutrient-binding outer membrane lipoprotein [Sphingobacterium yanglingense]|uniref:SusD/RagB-like outer membrane lipoprotein n=1 Tax=Sphingobacterium yanglingense TaxID=1437280 RepID=A0A4R6WBF7_9SPHI|nr:SusD/RagB family nutrient-binding outer membrane lipoprotein [Sphingobacterium yanglingense]TDQ76729.1 SusD/RagB-like outer membrane lipoprotein [Sphingobacterium yanglingense]